MSDWQGSESIQQAEHISPNKTGDNIAAKRHAGYVFDDVTNQWSRDTSGYRYGGGKSAYTTTLTAAGDTVALSPSSGNKLRVFWIAFVPDSDNSASNLVKVGFGSTTISTELYRGYALAHWEVFTGDTDQALIINTATDEPVAITIHYQEFTP